MARKRLTPARPDFLTSPLPRAPIAQVAGDAASAGAFEDVARELAAAREEGRLVQPLALEAVQADHLLRDRMGFDPAEMDALKASLAARGQQTPIEVVALGEGRFGLISGLRRLTALKALQAETGEARFATVLALVRAPESDAAAYTAMVEENEIRAGLSFYERARLVRRAVGAGVFPSEQAALTGLFAAASYSKRSKIKSFLGLVDALDDVLRHPAQIPEHLGLRLVKALAEDAGLAGRLRDRLAALDPEDVEAERAALEQCLSRAKEPASDPKQAQPAFEPLAPGLEIRKAKGQVVLKGREVTPDLIAALEDWLKAHPALK